MWARLYVDGDNRNAPVLESVKTVVAQPQAQLIFALGVETPVTPGTSREGRALAQLANANFWMNFERNHEDSPRGEVARIVPDISRHPH